MTPKLLRPQDVGENIQSFWRMTRDAVSYLAKTRGDAGFDNEIPNLEDVLHNFAAESKYIYQWYVEVSAACPNPIGFVYRIYSIKPLHRAKIVCKSCPRKNAAPNPLRRLFEDYK